LTLKHDPDPNKVRAANQRALDERRHQAATLRLRVRVRVRVRVS